MTTVTIMSLASSYARTEHKSHARKTRSTFRKLVGVVEGLLQQPEEGVFAKHQIAICVNTVFFNAFLRIHFHQQHVTCAEYILSLEEFKQQMRTQL